mmetsp:Transcript_3180/g.9034  ORF Transcript_3180/g.9034 Transcript_3180/m.9034 type:complete len:201 (+) Transcript_3180:671-1273(+)
MAGTALFSMLVNIASSSKVITTCPLTAFCSSDSDERSRCVSRLKRSISCPSTTLSEFSCPVSVRSNSPSAASVSMSMSVGTSASSAAAISSTISSGLLTPPPLAPPTLGWMPSTVSRSFADSCCWNEMLALGCMPNTSGASVSGSARMYSRYDSSGPSAGAKYVPERVNVYTSSRTLGVTYCRRIDMRHRRSLSSVTRPP